MPPEQEHLPKRIPLSGADRLMLAFDAQHRRSGGRGNVCAFAVIFASMTDARSLFQRIGDSPLARWLSSLRLRRGVFRACWRQTSAPPQFTSLAFTEERALFEYVANRDFDPVHSAPFSVVLAALGPSRAAILFFWHHALTDARGAESIIASLLFATGPVPPLWKPVRHTFSWSALANIRRHIFSSAAEPRSSLACAEKHGTPGFRYRRLHLTEAETAAADATGVRLGSQAFRSSSYLAAVCRAVSEIFANRGVRAENFFLTVPHSLRRFASTPLLGNRVSYLFYRVPIGRLTDDRETVHYLLDASTSIISNGLHHACDSFLRAVEVLPLPLVRRLLPRPSGGTMATFSFSDTGDLFAGRDPASIGLVDAYHLPPHFAPPGFTAVFTRLRGRLTVMLVAGNDALSDLELDRVENDLKQTLGIMRSKEDGAIHSV